MAKTTKQTSIGDFPIDDELDIDLDEYQREPITALAGTTVQIEDARVIPTKFGQGALVILEGKRYFWGGQAIVDQVNRAKEQGVTYPKRAKVLEVESKTGRTYYKLGKP